jgi:hypothetical protein
MPPNPDTDPVLEDSEWPTPGSMPRARPGISSTQLDDNVAIYDEVGQVLVMLNATASAVLDCCDGSTTFDAMVAQLAQRHSTSVDSIREDVRRTLRKLASMGLVSEPV